MIYSIYIYIFCHFPSAAEIALARSRLRARPSKQDPDESRRDVGGGVLNPKRNKIPTKRHGSGGGGSNPHKKATLFCRLIFCHFLSVPESARALARGGRASKKNPDESRRAVGGGVSDSKRDINVQQGRHEPSRGGWRGE